jgi:Protein of unknown function (DUF2950)
MSPSIVARTRIAAVLASALVITATQSCRSTSAGQRTFASPEDAANTLITVAKRGTLDDLMKIFGPEAQPLVDSSDPQIARQNRQVFVAAAAEGWRLDDNGPDGKLLIVGHESWPFPVPLVKAANRWRFDTAAGVEEVLARRVGRNELAAIRACRTYVLAQRLYASRGHDGKPAGLYATALRSDPGRQNGLYWPSARGEKRSPLGDLIAQAADDGKSPFHGYRFKILKSPDAKGFALVAWPATYDSTGVMTFVVSQDGIVREKDLGSETDRTASAMNVYNVDTTWEVVQ